MDMANLKGVLLFLLSVYGVVFFERVYEQLEHPKAAFVVLCIALCYLVLIS